MLLVTDTYYNQKSAKVVGALFDWSDTTPKKLITINYNKVLPYESGKFYKRELPCILKLLEEIDIAILEAITIDGHCYTSNQKDFGLGAHLWKSLDYRVPIIGIAKNSFHNTEKVTTAIIRGVSKKPLYISSIGYDLKLAVKNVKKMKGNYRIPDILKIVDQETREYSTGK